VKTSSYALSNLGRLNFPPLADLPATQAMAGLGIADELQAALTNPRFTQIFLSETLQYWLRDTMKLRYGTLNMLLESLKSSAVRIIAKRKEQRRPNIAGVFQSAASSSTQLQPTATAALDIELQGTLPRAYVATQEAPPTLSDHVILYKGKAVGDLNEEMFVLEDGSVNMQSIETQAGGDFNQQAVAWYWTEEEETAEIYREWGAGRCKLAQTLIIRIQIPKAFLDSLRKAQLFYSADWKEYVWYCRKKASAGSPPAKFNKLWRQGQAQFVRGHICGRAPSVIPRIKKEEIQQRMTEDDVLRIGDRKATQAVFMDDQVVKRLATLVRGKIHIEIFPALASPSKA
jgi:hypothetical protein